MLTSLLNMASAPDAELSIAIPVRAAPTAGADTGPQYFTLGGFDRGGTAPNGKTSLTIDQAAAKITRSNVNWGGTLGQPATVTFAFRDTAPAMMPDGTTGFSHFNATQITASELAFQAWSDVANITFTRVGSGTSGAGAFSDNATILLGNYSAGADGAAAFAFFPGSTAASSIDGDVWVNVTESYNATPVLNQYGYQVLTHEIGHSIGLDHPGTYNAGPGQNLNYAANAEYYEDSRQYSLMSYFENTETGANHQGLYAAAPLLDDIAASQRLYGANMTTRTGDTTYGFNSNAGRDYYSTTGGAVVFAVWDAGGTDTLDFSGYTQSQLIDLRPGAFSSVGGSTFNVAIAKGVLIENAIGGSGVDAITGNEAANTLSGGAGDDQINAAGGADTVNGDAGADTIFGGDGADVIHGGTENDIIVGNAQIFVQEADQLFGDAGNDTIYGENVDTINGGAGTDVLLAINSYDFTLDMGATSIEYAILDFGNDTITAATQTVRVDIFAGGGNDSIIGSAFDDLIFGSAGNDIIDGGNGADAIVGDVGIDQLTGGGGDDRIYFDAQDTLVSGGAGYDAGYITASTGAGVSIDLNAASIEFIQDFAGGNDTINGAALGVGFSAYVGAGNDTVTGSASADILWGETGDDSLTGNAGNDVLVGGVGSDVLAGGLGNDALFGNSGGGGDGVKDTFKFADSGAANADAVYDFVAGTDKIDVTAFATTFASIAIVDAGGSAIVYLAGQQLCTVVGVPAASLSAGDFVFTNPTPGDHEASAVAPLDLTAFNDDTPVPTQASVFFDHDPYVADWGLQAHHQAFAGYALA